MTTRVETDDHPRILLSWSSGKDSAWTLHRLLGSRPDTSARFRHNRGNRLAHDVIVVDETSMVSLTMMARLLEAVRPGARLVLVGDVAAPRPVLGKIGERSVVAPLAPGARVPIVGLSGAAASIDLFVRDPHREQRGEQRTGLAG